MHMSLTWLSLLLLASVALAEQHSQQTFRVSRGRCVLARLPEHQVLSRNAISCADVCSKLPRGCIGWSFRAGVCNVSDSVQSVQLTNLSNCQWWSALSDLGLIALWPMSNATRTRNVLSDTGNLDLHEQQALNYVGDAVNFTGQSGVNERYNVDELASVCLTSFTLSVWVKVMNPSLSGGMPILEGLKIPSDFYTRLWLHPNCSAIEFTIQTPYSRGSAPQLTVMPYMWVHIAAAFDNEKPEVKVFVDGNRVMNGSAVPVNSCADFGNQVQIGAVNRTTSHNNIFQGLMKCVGVANRAVTDGEVKKLIQIC